MAVLDSFWQMSQPLRGVTQWWPHHTPGEGEQEAVVLHSALVSLLQSGAVSEGCGAK